MPVLKRPHTVIIRNLQGEETWQYSGFLTRLLERELHLEAAFSGTETFFRGTIIEHGDLFLETNFTSR
jgi:hypothetical protein